MEPLTLAASALAVLTPYVKKAAEEFTGETGKAIAEKAGSLLAKLKSWWTGDEAATDTITRYEENPARYEPYLEDVLKEKLLNDPQLRSELAELLREIKEAGPDLRIVQRMKKAEEVVGLKAKNMTGGTASVQQVIEEGKKITGMDIDKIG